MRQGGQRPPVGPACGRRRDCCLSSAPPIVRKDKEPAAGRAVEDLTSASSSSHRADPLRLRELYKTHRQPKDGRPWRRQLSRRANARRKPTAEGEPAQPCDGAESRRSERCSVLAISTLPARCSAQSPVGAGYRAGRLSQKRTTGLCRRAAASAVLGRPLSSPNGSSLCAPLDAEGRVAGGLPLNASRGRARVPGPCRGPLAG